MNVKLCFADKKKVFEKQLRLAVKRLESKNYLITFAADKHKF